MKIFLLGIFLATTLQAQEIENNVMLRTTNQTLKCEQGADGSDVFKIVNPLKDLRVFGEEVDTHILEDVTLSSNDACSERLLRAIIFQARQGFQFLYGTISTSEDPEKKVLDIKIELKSFFGERILTFTGQKELKGQ